MDDKLSGSFARHWGYPIAMRVVATGVITVLGWFALALLPDDPKSGTVKLLREALVPNGVLVLLILALLVYLVWIRVTRNRAITSAEWFEEIAARLEDCAYARIYLRSFDHPDDFRGEHRTALMKIIQLIRDKLEAGADIQIVSYHPTNAKSGVDWLRSALQKSESAVDTAITVRRTQPVANATTMYLFDDKHVVFNRKSSGKSYTYHVEDYSYSILHELVKDGFENLRRAIP